VGYARRRGQPEATSRMINPEDHSILVAAPLL
jgi:hypothetical protein